MPSSRDYPTAPSQDQRRGQVALIILDMINRFDFPGGEALKSNADEIIGPILRLRRAMAALDAPVVYVNDNFNQWHSEKSVLVDDARRHNELVGRIKPRTKDFFVIKPHLSGFYATNLPVLLPKLGVSRLIVTGVAADMCVLFTAADAHMRDYAVWVPSDAVAAESARRAANALQIMRENLGADTTTTDELDPATWMKRVDAAG